MISGAGDPERARRALEAVDERLVRREDGLILLFDPPFDAGPLEPGYIKGYVPGIRENGGQYTHAATWVVQAFARLGRGRAAFELFDLLNPIRHADSPEAVARYKVEPYVVAADVYGRAPHVGRGGWTWYTGSAAWLYRVALEAILGFRRAGDRLTLDPCIPGDWPGFEMTYRHRTATYRIVVDNPHGVERGIRAVTLDGSPLHGRCHPARGRRPRPRGPGGHGTALNSRGATAARGSCRMALGLSKRVREKVKVADSVERRRGSGMGRTGVPRPGGPIPCDAGSGVMYSAGPQQVSHLQMAHG